VVTLAYGMIYGSMLEYLAKCDGYCKCLIFKFLIQSRHPDRFGLVSPFFLLSGIRLSHGHRSGMSVLYPFLDVSPFFVRLAIYIVGTCGGYACLRLFNELRSL